jgi:ubiquinone/menaquinone biosynthesis C-methylase UbiE
LEGPSDKHLEVFFEIHRDLPREGPGNAESTKRALAEMTKLAAAPHILDLGCGPGKQTLDLAQACDGSIIAVDNHLPFIEELNSRAEQSGLSERVRGEVADMHKLKYDPESFDALWCEGAIYLIGVEQGLRKWHRLLKKDGYIAFTDAVWLKNNPPYEVSRFWLEYPGMTTAKKLEKVIRKCRYELIDHFTLPKAAWWDDYYGPLEERLKLVQKRFEGDEAAKEIIDLHTEEIELYRNFSVYYGYEFFIARKTYG